MLKYTGHPLVDVGAATIAAFSDKSELAQVTEADLERMADFIADNYVVNPLKSFLTVAFPDSGFTQPAFEKMPEKRKEYAERVLRGFRKDAIRLAETCVFTGQPAAAIAFRQHVPLLTGEHVINFCPGGHAGLPVSGEALLCIQALPLGSAKCSGRLLLVHSDNPELTLDFARAFLQQNRRVLQLARQATAKKMPEARFPARTLLIQTLLDVEGKRQGAAEERQPSSVTAYHLSNSGQSPALDIYHLPLEMLGFLRQAISAEYRDQWMAITQRAWQLPRPKKKAAKGQEGAAEEDNAPRRNMLYEDIFDLPGNAHRFLRTYFLRVPKRYAKGKEQRDDPRVTYSLKAEADLVSWNLTKLFLRRVMNMSKDRIQQISNLGDRLATYIAGQNAKDFFRVLYSQGRYDYFRTSLLRADREHSMRSGNPLITLEEFYEVFEAEEEGILQADRWRWGRDLTLIRVVEQLCQNGWLARHPDAVPETPEAQEPES